MYSGNKLGLVTLLYSVLVVFSTLTTAAFAENSSTGNADQMLIQLAGNPDIKPGIERSKVAAYVWNHKYVLEELSQDSINAYPVLQGEFYLPYFIEYKFQNQKLLDYSITEVDKFPALEPLQKKRYEDEPWILIDRSILGYSFQVHPAWRQVHSSQHQGQSFSFSFDVLALPRIYDDELERWIENSVQWCIFERKNGYSKPSQVVKSEDSRLRSMGNRILDKTKQEGENLSYIYEVDYQGKPYIGKTYFFVHEGKGYSVRFNATDGTYAANLQNFEEFISNFVLSSDRPSNSDIELIATSDGQTKSILSASSAAN